MPELKNVLKLSVLKYLTTKSHKTKKVISDRFQSIKIYRSSSEGETKQSRYRQEMCSVQTFCDGDRWILSV